MLSREQIFKVDSRTYKEVRCPELGGAVRVQSLTGAEFEAWQDSNRDPVKKNPDGTPQLKTEGSMYRLLVRCMVDKAGNRLMSDDDDPALAKINAAALNRLGMVALRLNGVGAAEFEDLVKNSAPARIEDGPTS